MSARFDREIEIRPPTEKERLEILKVHTCTLPLAPDVDCGTNSFIIFIYERCVCV